MLTHRHDMSFFVFEPWECLMKPDRRVYPDDFKREIVKLLEQPGVSKTAIARDLGIGAAELDHWRRCDSFNAENTSDEEMVSRQEYESIRAELAKVKEERDVLKSLLVRFRSILDEATF